jgi:hypothetical protein
VLFEIYLVWAAALACSIKEYRVNRKIETEIIAEAERAPSA